MGNEKKGKHIELPLEHFNKIKSILEHVIHIENLDLDIKNDVQEEIDFFYQKIYSREASKNYKLYFKAKEEGREKDAEFFYKQYEQYKSWCK